MLRSIGVAAASALLFATALFFAFARSDVSPDGRPPVAETGQASTRPGMRRPTTPSTPSRAPVIESSNPDLRREPPAPPASRVPRREPDPWTPVDDIGPWFPDIYDVRDTADALLVGGTSLTPQTLPSEVTDPPESLVDPPPPPVVADDLDVEEVRPYAAVVTFTTDQDVAGVVGFGRGDTFGSSSGDLGVGSFASGPLGREHRIELPGLVPDTEYVVQIVSHTGEDRPEVSFTTDERPLTPEASIENGTVELDDQPFFPVTAYGACASQVENLLDAGVNVFGWDHTCGADEEDILDSIFALEGRAFWTLPWADRVLAEDGMIGFTQPDEPDGLGLHPSTLPDIDEPGKVTFLTLTQHFAPGTGDLPWQYPGYYEAFVPKADVLGVDFYPLQGLCSPEKLALNYDIQAELVRLAGGKPTLQWIEAAEMNCPGRPDAAITAETLRAEMLLAIAGGANGLGVFPSRLSASAASAVRSTLGLVEQAWPMLLTPRVPVEIGGDGASLVRASARQRGGATMVVVVNSSVTQSAAVEVRVAAVEDEQVFVSVDDALEVEPVEGVLELELEPLEAHILVAAPIGFGPPAEVAEDE